MIIGDGDIASVLPDRSDLLFFASGVSNSQEKDEAEYQREIDLLYRWERMNEGLRLVYFSTLAIFYSLTRYTQHKLQMEERIRYVFPQYTIIRLGNITWGKNPNTLINYLKAHPRAPIKNEYRYVCDQKELLHWINLIPDFNVEMNIPGRRLLVKEIVKEFV